MPRRTHKEPGRLAGPAATPLHRLASFSIYFVQCVCVCVCVCVSQRKSVAHARSLSSFLLLSVCVNVVRVLRHHIESPIPCKAVQCVLLLVDRSFQVGKVM